MTSSTTICLVDTLEETDTPPGEDIPPHGMEPPPGEDIPTHGTDPPPGEDIPPHGTEPPPEEDVAPHSHRDEAGMKPPPKMKSILKSNHSVSGYLNNHAVHDINHH